MALLLPLGATLAGIFGVAYSLRFVHDVFFNGEPVGLPKTPHELEGISLRPQLENAMAERERPAITSHNQGNFGIRTEQWRYIRYVDGAEELYDMANDPQEFYNLAAKKKGVIAEMKKWLPKIDHGPAVGSSARVLTLYDGVPVWEGEAIGKDDPVPQDQ
jgi:hypothetical protein